MTKEYYVYTYWRLDINEPFYVGKGKSKRWKRLYNRNKHFTNIVNKYPTIVVIEKDNLTEEEALYWEEEIIRQLVFDYGFSIDIPNNRDESHYCHLVNQTWGGEGTSGHNSYEDKTKEEMDEIKRKIRKTKIGVRRSEETRKRISKNHADMKGKNNPMYGVCGRHAPSSRMVICITTKKIFNTVKEGSEFYKCDSSGIIKCCRGKKKSCGKLSNGVKLVWRYLIWKHNKRYRIKQLS